MEYRGVVGRPTTRPGSETCLWLNPTTARLCHKLMGVASATFRTPIGGMRTYDDPPSFPSSLHSTVSERVRQSFRGQNVLAKCHTF